MNDTALTHRNHTEGAVMMHEAVDDLRAGASRWELWLTLAWQDIKKRYRGSVIGPFWITLSMAIWVGTIGFMYSKLFKLSLTEYLPFICLGFLFWSLISQLILDSCGTLIAAQGIIKQLNLPLSVFTYQMVLRNLIIFGHNILIFVVVALLFSVDINVNTLLVVPALVLYAVNGIWVGIFFGTLCARFRDIPPIVASLLQVCFFLTPIFWSPDLFKGRAVVYLANPFYHLVEIGRAPLLGKTPTMLSWVFCIALAVVGWAVALYLFSRVRQRVVYWL